AVASLLLEDPIFTSLVVAGLPIALERHDGSHDATLVGASDTDRERRAPGQATRTLVTGARCSATVNHERPASMLPTASPLVAPNHRPSASPSPSWSKAWRRIVR